MYCFCVKQFVRCIFLSLFLNITIVSLFLFLEMDYSLYVDISQNKGHKCIFNTV